MGNSPKTLFYQIVRKQNGPNQAKIKSFKEAHFLFVPVRLTKALYVLTARAFSGLFRKSPIVFTDYALRSIAPPFTGWAVTLFLCGSQQNGLKFYTIYSSHILHGALSDLQKETNALTSTFFATCFVSSS